MCSALASVPTSTAALSGKEANLPVRRKEPIAASAWRAQLETTTSRLALERAGPDTIRRPASEGETGP
jgi:hypothetical protein